MGGSANRVARDVWSADGTAAFDSRRYGDLPRQALVARTLGSPFVAAVLEAAQRQLHSAPQTAALIAGWPGDAAAAALAMRLNGALHALARRATPATLAALYRGDHQDFDAAIGAALAAHDAFIARWMRDPPQTNEVGRAAAIYAALLVAGQRLGMPFELLELGSSCGLNLNLARYAYELGGMAAGVAASPVRVAPVWLGSPPPAGAVEIVGARGVDLHPLDPADAATTERLLSFVWADQPARARRLEHALCLARAHPPVIERADAVTWLADRLATPAREGACRVVMHSMMVQYLGAADRQAIDAMIAAAGSRATDAAPLARISFEWDAMRSEVQLLLTCWPDGRTQQLASCHPYGDWVDWRGAALPE